MNSKQDINKLIDDTLNSLDGAGRATVKPYLFTRLNAKMQRSNEGAWDNVLRFISRPAVAMAVLCLVIVVNAMAVKINYSSTATSAVADEQQYASAYEYNNSVTVLDDTENIEP